MRSSTGAKALFRLVATMAAIAIPLEAGAACLKGINLAGAEFGEGRGTYGKDYTYPSAETIAYFAGKGFNAVRLPFKWERLQPRLGRGFDKAERTRLSDAVKALRKAGMTVILDPHNYAYYGKDRIGSDAVPDGAFADFWQRLAEDYKDDQGVQFGLMNEPYDVTATQWLASANAAIAAIRKTGATNLVLVPGTIWTGAHSWEEERDGGANGTVMLAVEDPANNHAYEVHQYLDADFSGKAKTCERADDAVKALERFTDWLKRNGKRGFLGEFGASADPACLDGLARMTALVGRETGVWTGWTYWAAGDWWPADEPLNIQPTAEGDRPQMAALVAGANPSEAAGSCPALP
ncbi:glycoside hydrolase family 5 protein [Shinella zoogloeoides]|uniref:glycoside hydrolase family 5 protein n=1 Tax=Shinella zoogloeoides TaxID=352475 RepID=UPI00273FB922|nr:glycoside hydrolase family 5 protein [Shinella zoogloeoides]WLR92584.1 glycoside hydrolase family 5 protein [Shinella zoogloeoides]